MARVIAIFFMMYVHAWTGESLEPDAEFGGVTGFVARVIVDVLGRSSVPLLTMISAYLLLKISYAHSGWPAVVRHKVRSLLLPLWLWNGLLLVLVWAAIKLTGAPAPAYVSNGPWWDIIFALTGNPATVPLGFLRDMFVCALFSPLLIWLARRTPLITVGLAFAFAVFRPEQSFFLRHQLLLFYVVGLCFALHWKEPTRPEFGWRGVGFALVVIGWFMVRRGPMAGIVELPDLGYQVFANMARFGVAWLVWMLCLWLQARRSYALFAAVESFVFIAFCSHFMLFRGLGFVLPADIPLKPLIFLAQPPLAIAFAFALAMLLRRTAPALLSILNGGRAPTMRW